MIGPSEVTPADCIMFRQLFTCIINVITKKLNKVSFSNSKLLYRKILKSSTQQQQHYFLRYLSLQNLRKEREVLCGSNTYIFKA